MINVIDCGARGGKHRSWQDFGAEIAYFMFEPEQQEHHSLALSKNDQGLNLFNTALGDIDGQAPLYIYSDPSLSSLKKLGEKVYRYRDIELVEQLDVPVSKLSTLCKHQGMSPDFLSIDAQGASYEVLVGCEDYLKEIWGIRAEVEFFQFYQDQYTFYDVGKLMFENGFVLARMETCGHPTSGFSTDMNGYSVSSQDAKPVWADAIFFNRTKFDECIRDSKFCESAMYSLLFLIHNGCGYLALELFETLPPDAFNHLSKQTQELSAITFSIYLSLPRRDYNLGNTYPMLEAMKPFLSDNATKTNESIRLKLEQVYGCAN